jgi:hypothetical protein
MKAVLLLMFAMTIGGCAQLNQAPPDADRDGDGLVTFNDADRTRPPNADPRDMEVHNRNDPLDGSDGYSKSAEITVFDSKSK